MKMICSIAMSMSCVGALFAVPSISNIRVAQDAATRTVAITYDLAGEPAVVTLSGVATNGASMAEDMLSNVSGAANRLVAVGNDNVMRWQPPQTAGFGPFAANTVSVSLQAWATNAPPDWMVVDLCVTNRVRYYASFNAIPGGVADVRYKTSYLVMRRIPAAGVVWRMGSPSSEAESSGFRSNEHTHYVTLDEDYYLGVYPVTYRQFYYLNGNANYSNVDPFAGVGGSDDDMPIAAVQYVVLRSWFHKNCDGTCSANNKYWPRDGHSIDGISAAKCVNNGGGTYTPCLRTMRNKYGLEFDLPTDAQWEFACRGGSSTYESRYGEMDDIAWYLLNSTNETYNCCTPHPVGLKHPNGYGLCDMLGGIAELCLDFYAESDNSDVIATNPAGPDDVVNDSSANRVTRGGTFDSASKFCRAAMRRPIGCTWADNSVYSSDTKGAVAAKSNGFRLWLPAHAVK